MFTHATYENGTATFEEGGLLVISSDAASEAENPQGRALGVEGLRDLVVRIGSGKADQVPDRIVQALNDWRCGLALEDDLTVVALKRTKNA